MKFDIVIIGGGLAGLTAAIALAKKNIRTALVSTGQSSLHFNTGSQGLIGFDSKHNAAIETLPLLSSLPQSHPYIRTGISETLAYASEAAKLLAEAGLQMNGDCKCNHSRISAMGALLPSWLTLEGMATIENLKKLPGKRLALVGIDGFLDFYPRFIAASLEKEGFECDIKTITTDELKRMRQSESEMRASNISRVLTGDNLRKLADAINAAVQPGNADAVLMPAVTGSECPGDYSRLRDLVETPLVYCATMGQSVPGIMMQKLLMQCFLRSGGTCFMGDSVKQASFDGKTIKSIYTHNLGGDPLTASGYIFAGGSFFSHALKALPDRIIEPVFDLDVVSPGQRDQWFDKDMFAPQPYMKAGIATDDTFRAIRHGDTVDNLYVAGSSLSGADSISEGSGAGVAMISALHVAKNISSLSN